MSQLANIKSSKKDIGRSRRRRIRNMAWRSRCKTLIRGARAAVSSGDPTVAAEIGRQACRQLDKAASKGVIPKRQAARRKSRLARRIARLTATDA
jgi:small subunit ribosomal protein S20